MTSLLELDSPGEFWYARAKSFYDEDNGNPYEYMNQARMWLNDYDFGMAEIAWNLVKMEHENSGR